MNSSYRVVGQVGIVLGVLFALLVMTLGIGCGGGEPAGTTGNANATGGHENAAGADNVANAAATNTSTPANTSNPDGVDLPRKTVDRFLNALASGHVRVAGQLVAKDERSWFDLVMTTYKDQLNDVKFQLLASESDGDGRAVVPVSMVFGENLLENRTYLCLQEEGEWRLSFWEEWAGVRSVIREIGDAMSMHFLTNMGWNKLPGTYPLADVAMQFSIDLAPVHASKALALEDIRVTIAADGTFTITVESKRPDGPPGVYSLDDMGNERVPRGRS